MDLNRLDRLGRNIDSKTDQDRLSQLKLKNDLNRLDRNRYRRIAKQVVADQRKSKSNDKNDLNDKSTRFTEQKSLSNDLNDKSTSSEHQVNTLLVEEETFTDPRDFDDLQGFDARLLGDLPRPPLLVIGVLGFDLTVVFDFRKQPTRRRKPKARLTFEISEVGTLIEAAENGRVRPRDFVQWCQRKQHDPYWRLTRETALERAEGLIRRPPESKNWTVGRLLNALDAKLLSINIVYQGAKTADHGPYMEVSND